MSTGTTSGRVSDERYTLYFFIFLFLLFYDITTKYSHIVYIHLTGSLSSVCAFPHSDYDVVILLSSECYD